MKNIPLPRILIYAALLTVFTGCGKSQTKITPNPPAPAITYQPLTKGSYWIYAYNKDGVTDTATITMTGLQDKYAAETYYEASTTYKLHHFTDTSRYLSVDAHVYKILSLAKQDTVNLYFFNDTTSLNNTWAGPVNNSGLIYGKPAQVAGGIVEQNISLTVQGITYTGVTHSKIYLLSDLGGNNYSTVEIFDYFMVKNIGPIEVFTSNGSGSTTSSMALVKYSIK